MRIYNYKVEKVNPARIIGKTKGEMYCIFKDGKRLFALEFTFTPSKNYLKKVISRNLYRPILPF